MPLHDFIERNGKTVKSHFLQKMIKYEKDEFELKKVLFQLDVIQNNLVLSQFLKRNLVLELDQICVSEDLMSTLYNGVTKPVNIELKKFGLNCTLQWPEGEEDYHVERHFYLIPNVCLTFPYPTPNGCDHLSYSFPDKIQCFVFYEEADCNPGAIKRFARNEDEINRHIPKSKSMKLCSRNEG